MTKKELRESIAYKAMRKLIRLFFLLVLAFSLLLVCGWVFVILKEKELTLVITMFSTGIIPLYIIIGYEIHKCIKFIKCKDEYEYIELNISDIIKDSGNRGVDFSIKVPTKDVELNTANLFGSKGLNHLSSDLIDKKKICIAYSEKQNEAYCIKIID